MSLYSDPGGQRRASVRDIEQIILSRIARGEYPTGQRLPSCERLGRELGANKNTVSKAFQTLARQGHLVSRPGRGTFVIMRPSQSWSDGKADAAARLMQEAVAQAAGLGLAKDELEALAADTIRDHYRRGGIRIGYVNCNRVDAREDARTLEMALGNVVEPLLVSHVGTHRDSDVPVPTDFDLLAVNIAHLSDVERRLRKADPHPTPMVIPVVIRTDPATLTQVARLPQGTRLLIISDTDEVLHTLTGAARGINQGAHVSGILSSSAHLEDAIGGADVVLVTRTAHRRVAALLREQATITASFKLDEQSIRQVAEARATIEQRRRPVSVN